MSILKKEPNKEIYEQSLSMGFTELQSIILGNRLQSVSVIDFKNQFTNPKPFPHPYNFDHGKEAISAIKDAVINRKKIWLVSDFDNDGIGAMSASFYLLTKVLLYPEFLLRIQVTKRSDGYGLTIKAIDKMLSETTEETRPDMLITMDLGSSNGVEIEYLKKHCPNMEIIVTDHHEVPPKDYPQNITAFINPNKPGCNYPDKAICGAAVVFFILDGVRMEMEDILPNSSWDPLWALSYVASSTVADAVSMESLNNRIIVSYGTYLMNTGIFPAWKSLKEKMERNESITEVTLGWLLGPMINSTSRLGEFESSPFRFFTAPSKIVADANLDKMEKTNIKRKEIQARLYELALIEAKLQENEPCLVIKLNESYPGIGGVVAGRLMNDYKKPVFVLMPSDEGILTGSCRAPSDFFVLKYLRALPEGTMLKFGGHSSVAGVSLKEENLELFKALINEEIISSGIKAIDKTLYDEMIDRPITFDLYDEIRSLAPYGQGFSQPVFAVEGEIISIENISKKTDIHKRVTFETKHGEVVKLNYFNAPPTLKETVKEFAFTIGVNHFRGNSSLQLSVEGM